jgi:amidohydrolase
MTFENDDLNNLIAFRKYLHKYPELSKKEHKTAKKIKEFLSNNYPDEIIEKIGGTGLAAIFKGENPGKTVLIRADIDALPIDESNDFEHKSIFPDIGHKCGHDGHTTILAGLSSVLHHNPPENGRVILLFQPAEETGEGAAMVINDPKFDGLHPDYVFGLHNLPGFEENTIVIRPKHFAAASKGMIARLTGKTSHAANPEHGISPALAVAEIIQKLSGLSNRKDGFRDFKLITLIHTRIGEIAFGTTPGYAEVMATLRSFRNDDMDLLSGKAVEMVENIADKYSLKEQIEWIEEFPATINNEECTAVVREVAKMNKLKVAEPETPFRWSEDFGYFTLNHPGSFFGVGAGKNQPELHNPDYDFPDKIIPSAIKMFDGIIRRMLAG